MNKQQKKRAQYLRRKHRVRARVSGTAERPRLCLSRSNKHLEAQLIDDVGRKTIVGMSDIKLSPKSTKTERAVEFGKIFGEAAEKAGVKVVVFDRNGRAYNGRVKAFAEAVRETGLQF